MTGVTAIIHTHNSEKTIGRLLESVSWADAIIVIDMESNDSTKNMVHESGATVHTIPVTSWNDGLRNPFLTLPQTPWTLVMDSDEFLAADAEQLVRQLIADAPDDVSAYALPRFNYVLGTLFTGEVAYPDHQIRLFRTGCVAYSAHHHQPPRTSDGGRVVNVDPANAPHIHHSQNSNIADYIRKQLNYALTNTYENAPPLSSFQEEALRRMLQAKEHTNDGEKAMLMVLGWDAIIRGLISWERDGRREPLPSDFGWALGFVVRDSEPGFSEAKAQTPRKKSIGLRILGGIRKRLTTFFQRDGRSHAEK